MGPLRPVLVQRCDTGIGTWLGLAGSVDYGGGAAALSAIGLGLIAQARGDSNGGSVAASLAHFAQLIQSDRNITGTSLPPVPDAPMPLSRQKNGTWHLHPGNRRRGRQLHPAHYRTVVSPAHIGTYACSNAVVNYGD